MKKKILALIALLLLFGGTTVAFAYWDNLEQTQNETLIIGKGVTLEVAAVATAPVGKVLVPSEALLKANDVTEIVLTYNVKLDQAVVTAPNLSVVASNVEINSVNTYASLVNIDIVLGTPTVNDADVLVTVTVSLDDVPDAATYLAIANQSITFDLTFTATAA